MTEENKFDSIDDLLDATLDDLDDMPSFEPYPAGSHVALATLELKEVADKQQIELTLKAVETLELAHPSKDEPLKAGDETSCLFDPSNEFAQGKMKKVLAALAETCGTRKTREIIEQTTDIEVAITTKIRKNKKDPDHEGYTEIVEITVT